MFGFFKKVSTLYSGLKATLRGWFSRASVDEESLKELEKILITADVGIPTTKKFIQRMKDEAAGRTLSGAEVQAQLKKFLLSKVEQHNYHHNTAQVYILVGVNGSGKTTTVAKLAHQFKKENKRVLVVGADTYRAAALEQLGLWCTRIGCEYIQGVAGKDPGAPVFTACEEFASKQYDILLIDTAGRLHTNKNLLEELKKIRSIVAKKLPDAVTHTLLTIDAMLGQNSFDQVTFFNSAIPLDGLILTKFDSSAKGGVICALAEEYTIPVAFITSGEEIDALSHFDSQRYIESLLEE